jgi:hypothetical protein
LMKIMILAFLEWILKINIIILSMWNIKLI